MSPFEMLKVVDLATGIVVSLLTGLIGFVFWVVRSRGKITNEIEVKIDESDEKTAGLLGELDVRVRGLEGRVGEIEIDMQQVAKSREVGVLSAQVQALKAEFSPQMKILAGQIDTLFKAALAAGKKDQ
ncbi:MAG: hypothetical protein AAF415_12975 [Pseudomonadota bacterium]